MYGEDIDLSYRITQGGFKNYYFPDTQIIHYKGESTKKGSLNYVKVFYNAMIIFAKKHFHGKQADFFIFMMQMAIYLRASITLLSNFFQRAYLPILDGLMVVLGLVLLKDVWASTYFNNPDYYSPLFALFNIPLYTGIWLTSIFFSGGYDSKYNLHRILRGVIIGTIILAAVYGFLELEYRTSRMLIVLGAVWTALSMIGLRLVLHFWEYKNFNLSREKTDNFIIVGSQSESERVQGLMYQAQIRNNFIGTVAPSDEEVTAEVLGSARQLSEIVRIYKINEIIFCAKNISAQAIMEWMTTLGSEVDYKIVAEESLSIIGSSSKNTRGRLYTIEVEFKIASSMNRRNKRVFDVLTCLGLLVLLPVVVFLIKQPIRFLQNLFNVFIGKTSWVGYTPTAKQQRNLPKIKKGILTPLDALNMTQVNEPTLARINFLYAKDYSVYDDLDILQKAFKWLGK